MKRLPAGDGEIDGHRRRQWRRARHLAHRDSKHNVCLRTIHMSSWREI